MTSKVMSVKMDLHPRSKHRGNYDFKILIGHCPELAPFVHINKYKTESIDFSDPAAVKMLNKALLYSYYELKQWDVPQGYLVPPIPGRADYIHYMADLLAISNNGEIPIGKKVTCLDIGVGANCIYPIIACSEYGWSFKGSDIDKAAVESAKVIVKANTLLNTKGSICLQENADNFFKGIIKPNEYYDFSISNPPFHSSEEEAITGSMRKLRNLNKKKKSKLKLNFGGLSNELWCEGGEEGFIKKMILESVDFSKSVFWFSSLVSKESNLKSVLRMLKVQNVEEYKVIEMNTGNKKTRFVTWTFLTKEEQTNWRNERWK